LCEEEQVIPNGDILGKLQLNQLQIISRIIRDGRNMCIEWIQEESNANSLAFNRTKISWTSSEEMGEECGTVTGHLA